MWLREFRKGNKIKRMNLQKFERLRRLREDFEQISVQTYENWSKVES